MIIIILCVEALLILGHVSLPFMRNVSLQNQASAIIRDMNAVRAAAVSARQATGEWPADDAAGQPPEALKSYLPPGLSFAKDGYELDWDSYMLSEASTIEPTQHALVGVSVVTVDPLLAAAVARQLGAGDARFMFGNRTTLVIAEPAAAP